ncbi:MBL fold metallo-hydrolase [Halospeciosus flavus]|uniref:MBL fold metallo-hydrolase n=1 Tax=Halospeciosus flavus TaxID=3032283 RepID=A0ABD5Z4W8_9EURY|nr:MBL fold metallo-hydrolase [Halospeciosus flavus]
MKQIQLGNDTFEGRNSVYLLGHTTDAAGPLTLVDTGVATDATDAELRAALAECGVDYADLDRILLTHWHYDHAGLAGQIQTESGAEVYVHEADAPLVAQDPEATEAVRELQFEEFADWGMPAAKRAELESFFEGSEDLRGEPVDVTPVTDGDRLAAGEHEVRVVHLPGHAAGLVAYVFEREGRREAFLGDSVLPKYTPNVGGADVRVEEPLANYLASLERVVDLDLDRGWPGHRGPIFAPTARAHDIAEHHAERAERVLAVLREHGPATPWEVSAELFGSLSNVHIMHGPGEAYAHLDHLAARGWAERTDDGYTLAADAPVDVHLDALRGESGQ